MAFLGVTFFPVENLPDWARAILTALPLTHAARAIRADALGGPPEGWSFLVLSLFGLAALALAVYAVAKAKD